MEDTTESQQADSSTFENDNKEADSFEQDVCVSQDPVVDKGEEWQGCAQDTEKSFANMTSIPLISEIDRAHVQTNDENETGDLRELILKRNAVRLTTGPSDPVKRRHLDLLNRMQQHDDSKAALRYFAGAGNQPLSHVLTLKPVMCLHVVIVCIFIAEFAISMLVQNGEIGPRSQSFRYFRFTPLAVEGGGAIQSPGIAQLMFMGDGCLLNPRLTWYAHGANGTVIMEFEAFQEMPNGWIVHRLHAGLLPDAQNTRGDAPGQSVRSAEQAEWLGRPRQLAGGDGGATRDVGVASRRNHEAQDESDGRPPRGEGGEEESRPPMGEGGEGGSRPAMGGGGEGGEDSRPPTEDGAWSPQVGFDLPESPEAVAFRLDAADGNSTGASWVQVGSSTWRFGAYGQAIPTDGSLPLGDDTGYFRYILDMRAPTGVFVSSVLSRGVRLLLLVGSLGAVVWGKAVVGARLLVGALLAGLFLELVSMALLLPEHWDRAAQIGAMALFDALAAMRLASGRGLRTTMLLAGVVPACTVGVLVAVGQLEWVWAELSYAHVLVFLVRCWGVLRQRAALAAARKSLQADKARYAAAWAACMTELPEQRAIHDINSILKVVRSNVDQRRAVQMVAAGPAESRDGDNRLTTLLRGCMQGLALWRRGRVAAEGEEQGGAEPAGRLRLVKDLDQLCTQAWSLDPVLRHKVWGWARQSGGMLQVVSAGGDSPAGAAPSSGKVPRTASQDSEAATAAGGRGGGGAAVEWRAASELGSAKEVQWAGVKRIDRALEKMQLAYGGKSHRLLDVCRQRVAFASAEGLLQCLLRLLCDKEAVVRAVKDRLDPQYDAAWSGGFRAVVLHLSLATPTAAPLARHICELQLVLLPMALAQAEADHNAFMLLRNARVFGSRSWFGRLSQRFHKSNKVSSTLASFGMETVPEQQLQQEAARGRLSSFTDSFLFRSLHSSVLGNGQEGRNSLYGSSILRSHTAGSVAGQGADGRGAGRQGGEARETGDERRRMSMFRRLGGKVWRMSVFGGTMTGSLVPDNTAEGLASTGGDGARGMDEVQQLKWQAMERVRRMRGRSTEGGAAELEAVEVQREGGGRPVEAAMWSMFLAAVRSRGGALDERVRRGHMLAMRGASLASTFFTSKPVVAVVGFTPVRVALALVVALLLAGVVFPADLYVKRSFVTITQFNFTVELRPGAMAEATALSQDPVALFSSVDLLWDGCESVRVGEGLVADSNLSRVISYSTPTRANGWFAQAASAEALGLVEQVHAWYRNGEDDEWQCMLPWADRGHPKEACFVRVGAMEVQKLEDIGVMITPFNTGKPVLAADLRTPLSAVVWCAVPLLQAAGFFATLVASALGEDDRAVAGVMVGRVAAGAVLLAAIALQDGGEGAADVKRQWPWWVVHCGACWLYAGALAWRQRWLVPLQGGMSLVDALLVGLVYWQWGNAGFAVLAECGNAALVAVCVGLVLLRECVLKGSQALIEEDKQTYDRLWASIEAEEGAEALEQLRSMVSGVAKWLREGEVPRQRFVRVRADDSEFAWASGRPPQYDSQALLRGGTEKESFFERLGSAGESVTHAVSRGASLEKMGADGQESQGASAESVGGGAVRLVRVESLDQVFAQAQLMHPLLLEKVKEWAARSRGMVRRAGGDFLLWEEALADETKAKECKWGALKRSERAIEKQLRSYGGDPSLLVDICRQSLIFACVADLVSCLAAVSEDPEVRVLRIKNRLDPGFNSALSAGYRDVALNLEIHSEKTKELAIEHHVMELQLILVQFARLKSNEGHKRYVAFRNARAE